MKGRYPEVAIEEIVQEDPDLSFYLLQSHIRSKKEDGYEISNYTDKAQTVLVVDGEMFSWYGSRLLSIYIF
jgi:hypothetical protein